MTSNHFTPLATSTSGTKPSAIGETFNTPLGELDSAITNMLAGTQAFTLLKYADGGELTIATGAVTLTNAYHNIDTQSDAASDNLDTINGLAVGKFAYLMANNTARTVVLTHNVGNILTVTGASISLDDDTKIAFVFHNGTNVIAMELGVAAAAGAFSGARVIRTGVQSIANSSTTAITWQSEDYDTDTYITVSATTFDPPTNGKYRVTVNISFASNATGVRRATIRKNTTSLAGQTINAISGESARLNVSLEIDALSTDTFDVQVFQTSGGNLDVEVAETFFSIERLSDDT